MDDTVQSPKNTNPNAQNISQQTVNQPPQQQATSDPVSGALPSKEHAPLTDALKEHVKPSDPLEAQPEIQAELKEHGVEARQDEAKLELTRSHQQSGMSHPPAGQTVSDHVKDEKPEFPLTQVEALEAKKKASFKDSIRWLAEEILRQMKIEKPPSS